jgi:redox-regulated HSP33 family molecular chaperone
MAKLPFVVQPKRNTEIVALGNEEIGVIEIERKGYLTVAEKTFVDSVMQGSDGITLIVGLANKIAKGKKISTERAYSGIIQVISGDISDSLTTDISEKYPDEIAKITATMADSVQRRSIAAATILIQTRINHEWTFDDTMKLDPELVAEFLALYEKEEQRLKVDNNQTEEEKISEIVGK